MCVCVCVVSCQSVVACGRFSLTLAGPSLRGASYVITPSVISCIFHLSTGIDLIQWIAKNLDISSKGGEMGGGGRGEGK